MKSIWIAAALWLCLFLASCSSSPRTNMEMRQHLSEVSASPPVEIQYSKTVNAYKVSAQPDWSKIPESHIATTILSEMSRTAGIGISLAVQAAWNAKKIFFRVTWPDAQPHLSKDWNKAEKLSFNWGVRSDGFANAGCGAACHFWPPDLARGRISGMWLPESDGLADNWMWMAVPVKGGKTQHRLLTGKPVVIPDKMKMPGMPRHYMRLAYFADPFPTGLKGYGEYSNGEWVVTISRPLATSRRKAVRFSPSENPYQVFGMSVFPGVMYHDYSGMLTLHFLSTPPPR